MRGLGTRSESEKGYEHSHSLQTIRHFLASFYSSSSSLLQPLFWTSHQIFLAATVSQYFPTEPGRKRAFTVGCGLRFCWIDDYKSDIFMNSVYHMSKFLEDTIQIQCTCVVSPHHASHFLLHEDK